VGRGLTQTCIIQEFTLNDDDQQAAVAS